MTSRKDVLTVEARSILATTEINNDFLDKEKGPKCFKCAQFGHVALKCTKSAGNSEAAVPAKVRVDAVKLGDKKTKRL